MVYLKKAMSLALLFIILLSVLAGFVGEPSEEGGELPDATDIAPAEDTKGVFGDLRGTRSESLNIELLSRPLYGLATDVFTVGNYAYVYVGANFMIFDVTDKSDPQLVGIAKTYNYGFTLEVVGSYAYLADRYYGLLIFDVSDPSSPEIIGEYRIGAGMQIADFSISGTMAYLALVDEGLTAVDISVPSNPHFEGEYTGYDVLGVLAEGTTVYAACGFDGLRIIDMSAPGSPVELGYNDTHYSERVEVSGDTAYVGYFSNIWMVDITDPSSPSDLGLYEMTDIWEIIIENNIAYVANGWGGFNILDVSDPPNLSEIGSYETDGESMGVHLLGDYVYVADMNGGLVIIDVSNPSQPSEVGSFYTGYYPEGAVARGGFAYVADGGDGIWIFDVSDPTNPIGVSNISRIEGSDLYVYAVTLREDIIYVADLNRFYTINVADPYNPVPLGNDFLDGTSVDIHLDWPYAYLPDTFGEGVFIYNVIDPYNPQEIAQYNEVNEAIGVDVSGDYLYTASLDLGLNIADVTDPANPINTSTFDTPGWAVDVFIQGDYAYIADYDRGLRIADISEPSSPSYVSDFDTDGLAWGVFVTGGFAFIADDTEGLRVIDVTNPHSLSEVGYYNTSGSARDVFVHGSVAYVSSRDGGLYLLDVSQFTSPQINSTFPEPNATQVSENTSIIINFTESMDTNSVESAFSYTDGSQTWGVNDGSTVWMDEDKTLTFSPHSVLEKGIEYEVTVAHTAMDKDGSLLDGDEDGIPGEVDDDDYSWSFTTIPPPPQITSTYPGDGAQDVFISTAIIANFSKTMDRNSVESAFSYTDGITVWDVSNGAVNWNNNDTTFTFTPSGDLQHNAQYRVNISYLAMDMDGFLLDGDEDGISGEVGEDNYTWGFTTIPISPTIESTFPQHGSTLILTNTDVIINFSRSMDKTSTKNALSYTDGTSTWTASSGQVEWSNDDRTLTFSPFGDLENEKTYTFTIAHTATDANGTGLDGDNDGIGGEGAEDDFSWNFTTIPIPPRISSVDPGNLATKVPLDSSLVLVFTKPMNRNSVESAFSYTNGTLTWGISDGNVVWTDGDRNFSFKPSSPFDNSIEYQVTMAHTAMDKDNIFFDGDEDGVPGEAEDDYAWSFTTVPPPPQIISTFPQHGSTQIPIDTSIIIYFSKSMDRTFMEESDGAFSYTDGVSTWDATDGYATWNDDDKTLTFDPYDEFDNDKTYTFTIEHTAKDIEGIELDGDYDGIGGEGSEDDHKWSFTTMPEPPRVTRVDPRNYAAKVSVGTDIFVKFTKQMNPVSVENAFKFTYEGTDTIWDAANGSFEWNNLDKEMTFTPSSKLVHEKTYTVTIEATAMDTEGITMENDHIWSFTTKRKPPEVVSVEPEEGMLDVAVDADIVITFDTAMDRTSTKNAFTYTYEDSPEVYDSSSGSIEWSNGDKTLTFNSDFEFEEGKIYTVTIESTAEDENGMALDGDEDGIGGEEDEDDYSWSFTIKVKSPPVLMGGGVFPPEGYTSDSFNFAIVYLDVDNDEPTEITVVIDEVSWPMEENNTDDDNYVDGKIYIFTIRLEEGEHTYYFQASDEKFSVRHPEGNTVKTLKVYKKQEEPVFGFLKKEYLGMPTLICLPMGLIILIAIIVSLIMVKRRRAGGEMMTFETFEEGGAEPMAFTPIAEEEPMMFTAFEGPVSLEEAEPIVIRCPECEQYLKVKAAIRPFEFPCKCGANLVLK